VTDLVLFREMSELFPGLVRLGEPLHLHTSWRIGGPADFFVEPGSLQELQRAVSYAHGKGLPLTVIGAGSNVLVSDRGIRGMVIKIGSGLARVTVRGQIIEAEAGARLSMVAAAARDNGLGGFEFAAGIPGTVGGAIVMNAGANGLAVGELVTRITVMGPGGELLEKAREELRFGYRSSSLQQDPAVVAAASFCCYPRNVDLIRQDMENYLALRRDHQPLASASAGSVFKNPAGKSAGWLIDNAGGKGLRVGNARVSEQHANFIVNLGSATARDVLALIEKVRALVLQRFGVKLELEVRFLGE